MSQESLLLSGMETIKWNLPGNSFYQGSANDVHSLKDIRESRDGEHPATVTGRLHPSYLEDSCIRVLGTKPLSQLC